jgi:hypothetical protein
MPLTVNRLFKILTVNRLFKILTVNVTVFPVFPWLERLNYRVSGLFKVLCCVPVF